MGPENFNGNNNGAGFEAFMPDGNPEGFMKCTIDNWDGFLVRISRNLVDKYNTRDELKQTGVYILLSKADEDEKPVAYVGHAGFRANEKGFMARLQEHVRKKGYWDEAMFFTQKEDKLGATEIFYLENSFYNLAKKADRYVVKNDNTPSKGNCDEKTKASLNTYIEYAKLMMKILGCKIFTPKPSKNNINPENGDFEIHLCRTVDGFKTEGHAIMTNDGVVVLAGSILSPSINKAYVSKDVIRKREDAKIVNNVLEDNVTFNTPSGAASFIIGNAADGWSLWQDENGVTINERLNREISNLSNGKSKNQGSTSSAKSKNSSTPSFDAKTNINVFLTRKNLGSSMTVKAKGVYDAETRKLTVLAGSIVSPVIAKAVENKVKRQREHAKIENNVLMEDIVFSSPSGAAEFVIGNTSNGLVEWKDESGVELKKLSK